MKYHLKNIDFLDEKILNKLISSNIYNTDNVIDSANTELKRKSLAIEKQISLEDIEFLASLSDLVRIKGVAVKTARKLIESCNFRNVQDIAQFNIINTSKKKENDFSDWFSPLKIGQFEFKISKVVIFAYIFASARNNRRRPLS